MGAEHVGDKDGNVRGRERDSLHDDYVDSIHRDQDDGLPPDTCTQTPTLIHKHPIHFNDCQPPDIQPEATEL